MGLRVPDHALCSAILERCGPFAGTSANSSGSPAFTGEGDRTGLPAADAMVDDGPTRYRCESTIVDLSAGEPRVVREGASTGDDLGTSPGADAGAPPSDEASARARGVRRSSGRRSAARQAAAGQARTGRQADSGRLGEPARVAAGRVQQRRRASTRSRPRSIDTNLNTGVFSRAAALHGEPRRHADLGGQGDRQHADQDRPRRRATSSSTGPRRSRARATSRIGPEPSTLTCDKLDIDGGKKFYVATGNVHFTQGTRDATADRGTLDEVTGLLHLAGNVHIRDKEQYLDGDDVVYNTKTGDVARDGQPRDGARSRGNAGADRRRADRDAVAQAEEAVAP